MKHWWVPGLQIGYEHTLTHQSADFVEAAASGKALPADLPRRPRDRQSDGRGAQVGEQPAVEKV